MDQLLKSIYSIKKTDLKKYEKYVMLGGGTRPAPVLLKGKGCWVEDIEGKRYLDYRISATFIKDSIRRRDLHSRKRLQSSRQ